MFHQNVENTQNRHTIKENPNWNHQKGWKISCLKVSILQHFHVLQKSEPFVIVVHVCLYLPILCLCVLEYNNNSTDEVRTNNSKHIPKAPTKTTSKPHQPEESTILSHELQPPPGINKHLYYFQRYIYNTRHPTQPLQQTLHSKYH